MKKLALLLLIAASSFAQTEFEAVKKKALWPDQYGTLRLDDAGISFAPDGKSEQARSWTYEDIQHFDRLTPTEFVLLSYEDVPWQLGRDRSYRFVLSTGAISDELYRRIAERINKPVTNRVVRAPSDFEQEMPVKSLALLGGSEGTLHLSKGRIVYLTKASERSREWVLGRGLESIWSSDPYRLEVHAYEGNPGFFRKPTVYKFALKKPLDPEVYRRFKLELYELDHADGETR